MGELQGRVFGGYQLQDEIGGGGVAEVYRARPATGGGREVVVKVIYQEFARQPGFARNFAYVTEASARLASHPHILPLIAHGEEGEFLYLVTPYVKEGTLADWLARGGRLSAADVGPFFQQLCGALSYAHSLGVVHGNIKPSNIFLHEGRHILLGDFGLLWDVRALDPKWSGSGVEAFEYLAPEVFAGQITQASDMYSLGASLFHSLSGRPPFHTNKLADLISAAQQQPPPSLGQQQPPLALAIAALDPVVAQAMAKRPEERYASAVALAQGIDGALRQAAAGGAQVAPPTGRQPQWQPLASAPVSAGMFNAPGQAGAGMGALAGAMPLTQMAQLDSPFPPLPPSAEVDGAMEQGGVALAAGMAFNPAASQILDPPTLHIAAPAAPTEGPTMRVAAPPATALGAGAWNSAPLGADGQPITSPRTRAVRPPAGQTMAESFAASGLMPLDPPDEQLDASIRRISERLPAIPRDGAHADIGAASGQFSPTELGLPRLTNPALGNLPADWQELLTDENASRRHDPFEESSGRLPPIASAAPADAPYGQSSAALPARTGRRPARASRRLATTPPTDTPMQWEAPSPETFAASGAFAASNLAEMRVTDAPPHRRARKADYNIEELSEQVASRKNPATDDYGDTLQEQKVWTNSQQIVRIGKRITAAPIVVMLLALVILVELAGFAVIRPDLCVTHACAIVAGKVEQVAPGLHIPGAPAPVTFTPGALKVTATTNGTGAITVTLTNAGASAFTWSATTTLGWLKVSPASGALAQGAHTTLTLTAQPDGVSPGSYTAGLVVDAATGQSAMPIALTVIAGPILTISTPKLAFSACGVSQPLTIANTGAARLSYTASPSQASALSVNPGSGSLAPGDKTTLSVTLSCAATPGQSYAVILVSDGGSAQAAVTYGA